MAYWTALTTRTVVPSTIKVTLSPDWTPRTSRTSLGMVTWPLDMTFALSVNVVGMDPSLGQNFP